MPSLIKRFNNEYHIFNDAIESLLIQNEFNGYVPHRLESKWIIDLPGSPLDRFNMFLLSEGFLNASATVVTDWADEYYTTYPMIVYKNSVVDIDRFYRYVNNGMRKGYMISCTVSQNQKPFQNRYLVDIFDDGIVFGTNPETGFLFGSADSAITTLIELEDKGFIVPNSFITPKIIESHENPFKNREITLAAFSI